MREGNSVLITIGHRVASQGKAGGVKMVDAFIKAFLGPDGQGQFAQPRVTTIGVDLIERATALKAVEHLRTYALTTHESEGFVGKKRWGSRQRTMGTPHAIEDPPDNRFARGDLFLVMEQPSRVDHLEESYASDFSTLPLNPREQGASAWDPMKVLEMTDTLGHGLLHTHHHHL